MRENKPTGQYLVITILVLAAVFSLALSLSVKSLVRKMKNDAPRASSTEEPGKVVPAGS